MSEEKNSRILRSRGRHWKLSRNPATRKPAKHCEFQYPVPLRKLGNLLLLSIFLAVTSGDPSRADTLEFLDRTGESTTLTGRLIGTGQGVLALELPDGTIRLIPEATVRRRIPGPDPEPLTHDVLADRLEKQFGKNRFLWTRQDSFLIGLVLESEIDNSQKRRANGFLRKAARFMKNVENIFLRFSRELRFSLSPPRYPLVILIYESDRDFEKSAREATGGRGLSAGNIAGFYSSLTNHLYIRLSECHTFETPLHEAIHQQIHNRGVLQRLAPVPVWFNEGIATGFEGNAERIDIGPTQLSKRYAQQALQPSRTSWSTVIEDDRTFRGDVLAGEAYTHAWGLHWLLVNQHRVDYMKYVRRLGQFKPLEEIPPATRRQDFEQCFGQSTEELREEFDRVLRLAFRRQKSGSDRAPAGLSVQQTDMAEVRIEAVNRGGRLHGSGRIKNISPIRSRAFRVFVIAGNGTYAEWRIPELGVGKTRILAGKFCDRMLPGRPRGNAGTFQVFVQSAAAGTQPAGIENLLSR